jgi:hypothetical protein
LQCVAVCCSMGQCVAPPYNVAITGLCLGVLQCVAVCCSVLQCVAVCCSVWQCVVVCCSVLQCVAVCLALIHVYSTHLPTNPPPMHSHPHICCRVLRALQCVAVQCVSARCDVFPLSLSTHLHTVCDYGVATVGKID